MSALINKLLYSYRADMELQLKGVQPLNRNIKGNDAMQKFLSGNPSPGGLEQLPKKPIFSQEPHVEPLND